MPLIRSVEFFGLRSRLPQPALFSWGSAAERNVGLLRVALDGGAVGFGETSVTFPLWTLEERAFTVRDGLAPLVIGSEAFPPEQAVAQLQRTLGRLGPLWSRVAIQSAIGAFELALWDASGKIEERPLYDLLGGERRPATLYAVGFVGGPDEIARQAEQALADGYAAVKVRVGLDPERDEALVRTVRESIGPSATLLVDANMAWSRDEARQMAERLAAYELGWLEEPLDCDDVDGLAELRGTAGLPIAAGENATSAERGAALVEAGAVDVLMPDIARCGGVTATRRMIRAGRARGIPYSLHHYASDVGFAAMLHVCAAEPGALPLLRDTSTWPLRGDVLTEPIAIEEGTATPPDGPGLGITIEEEAIAQHRVI